MNQTTVRVGAVDCGTNSIRLLIADVLSGGALVSLARRAEVVRLGDGVDRTGRIDPAAMERTRVKNEVYAAMCREHDVSVVRFVATSASRDAANAADFVRDVEQTWANHGYALTPEVISGAEEASLSFRGATGGLREAGIAGPFLIVDLGGGSTELVRGDRDVDTALSLDIGSVRIFERHLHSDPPVPAELEAARADIATELEVARREVGFGGVETVVGLAGSITTVTAHLLGLTAYDSAKIHLAQASVAQHVAAAESLLQATRAERAALGFMHPGRVDVIGAGALVWSEVLQRVAADSPAVRVVTSERDILDGIALSLVQSLPDLMQN